jgi:hypothetical protein
VRKVTGHRSRELERYQHLTPELRALTVNLIATELFRGKRARKHYCPVIAWANRCNLLTGIEIDANSRRDDIFSAPVFPAKIVARNAARQNAACWLAAPSSLS